MARDIGKIQGNAVLHGKYRSNMIIGLSGGATPAIRLRSTPALVILCFKKPQARRLTATLTSKTLFM